ncbi:MAG TPA: hypothetical protein PLV21_06565 [Cyclobacteriaceae bacterium]|nr:hypothetical protein [Cyclobacteriaceae bacterium]HRJ81525.1 hypothetical protein [Cyclobacteriaceae bacterium]
MAKTRRKKNKKQKQGHALFGATPVMEHPVAQTVTKGGLVLLAAIAAGGAGAALGKHSLLAGIPVTLVGFHKKNPYIIAAGLGLTLSNGFQNQNKTTVQGVDGFDIKQIAEQAKDRVETFFKNFSEKLYIAKAAEPTATAGLAGENSEEQVTYFVNPYNDTKELDMSAIDRIQEQIASMNGGMNAVEEVEREF